MTSAQVVETSVNVISNSPSQDYTHPDDRTLLNDMTPGFKPFTIYLCISNYIFNILLIINNIFILDLKPRWEHVIKVVIYLGKQDVQRLTFR